MNDLTYGNLSVESQSDWRTWIEDDDALEEVDAAALAVAETPEQVVRLLAYVVKGEL